MAERVLEQSLQFLQQQLALEAASSVTTMLKQDVQAPSPVPSRAFAYFVATDGPSTAPLGASLVAFVPAPSGSCDDPAMAHASSQANVLLGLPSSCAPPLGEVGPVASGSSVAGATGSTTSVSSMVGVTRSAPAHLFSKPGASVSTTCCPLSAANGCSSSVNSALQLGSNLLSNIFIFTKM